MDQPGVRADRQVAPAKQCRSFPQRGPAGKRARPALHPRDERLGARNLGLAAGHQTRGAHPLAQQVAHLGEPVRAPLAGGFGRKGDERDDGLAALQPQFLPQGGGALVVVGCQVQLRHVVVNVKPQVRALLEVLLRDVRLVHVCRHQPGVAPAAAAAGILPANAHGRGREARE
ncbi:MAG: hypothetical protein AUJ96_12750 [Armatimonadetes bacterium CG2_30_66_41]|nr:MAG: hypothetical protein AUJ96_12750 [Armatimonadetes bacterium CG2_30_66_41]